MRSPKAVVCQPCSRPQPALLLGFCSLAMACQADPETGPSSWDKKASGPSSTPLGGAAQVSVTFDHAPRVLSLRSSPGPLQDGVVLALAVLASDPDGDVLTYSWRSSCAGVFDPPTAPATSYTPSLRDDVDACTVSVDVDDGRRGVTRSALTISTREPTLVASPSMGITVQSADRAAPGETVDFLAFASAPGNVPLLWRWTATAGVLGPQQDGSGQSQTTWTAPASMTDPCTVTVAVSTQDGGSASYDFVVRM